MIGFETSIPRTIVPVGDSGSPDSVAVGDSVLAGAGFDFSFFVAARPALASPWIGLT